MFPERAQIPSRQRDTSDVTRVQASRTRRDIGSGCQASVVWRIALLLVLLVLVGCMASKPTETPDPFPAVVGATLDPRVRLVTNHEKYRDDQPIGYEVQNMRSSPLYFPDYTFGIRAYSLDEESQQWTLLAWDCDVIDPEIVAVRPGPPHGTENVYAISMMCVPASGKLRLAVIGWADPNNPEGTKIAAYTDIEIVR